ncbi:predicted protein [Plenodomus lingam JN3]|uniref:Predicted protein n=1 Tax=Leptosphaeria maculans (strain JN3 / isolate v23.1.3 / race Av1-4-5-6-7-8) TaxID=985895 RepID=E4ZNC9_LEPMJ|nr:predicted protein [Plenodomus lingam JN3]CBX92988.1 predicted protein [Plenodomus lingam JN3]
MTSNARACLPPAVRLPVFPANLSARFFSLCTQCGSDRRVNGPDKRQRPGVGPAVVTPQPTLVSVGDVTGGAQSGSSRTSVAGAWLCVW